MTRRGEQIDQPDGRVEREFPLPILGFGASVLAAVREAEEKTGHFFRRKVWMRLGQEGAPSPGWRQVPWIGAVLSRDHEHAPAHGAPLKHVART